VQVSWSTSSAVRPREGGVRRGLPGVNQLKSKLRPFSGIIYIFYILKAQQYFQRNFFSLNIYLKKITYKKKSGLQKSISKKKG
jgi:hypothetical protein